MVELVKEDIDVVLFETMTDIYELKVYFSCQRVW